MSDEETKYDGANAFCIYFDKLEIENEKIDTWLWRGILQNNNAMPTSLLVSAYSAYSISSW